MPPVTTTLVIAGADHRVGDLDSADRGGADLVDRVRRDLDRNARPDRGLPGRRLAYPRLEHLAHDDVLDLVRLEPGPLESGLDRDPAQLRSLVPVRPPPSFPNGVLAVATMTDRLILLSVTTRLEATAAREARPATGVSFVDYGQER